MDAAAATARLTTAEAMILLILFLLYRECGVCVGGLGVGGSRRTPQHAHTTLDMRGTCLARRTAWNKAPQAAQSTARSTR